MIYTVQLEYKCKGKVFQTYTVEANSEEDALTLTKLGEAYLVDEYFDDTDLIGEPEYVNVEKE